MQSNFIMSHSYVKKKKTQLLRRCVNLCLIGACAAGTVSSTARAIFNEGLLINGAEI